MEKEATRIGRKMKIQRSSKIYFTKWLTLKKQEQIKTIIQEYSKLVNYFIDTYKNDIPKASKLELLLAKYIQKGISDTDTWLTARMVKNAFAEGYGMVQSYKSNLENNDKHKEPVHTGKKITLSETINTQFDKVQTKDFDFNVTLGSIGNKLKISIPLRKHKQFNKWDKEGKRSKSIVLTDRYIQFTFEVETGKKKLEGINLGLDIGVNKLIATSERETFGDNLKNKIAELKLKKRKSKAYDRKKEEIKEYINYELKKINWSSLNLLVCEKLKDMKNKMKLKRRLGRGIRRVLSDWNYRFVLDRLEALCEENRVSFRSVLPYYTSQKCSVCGHTEKGNRVNQEQFKCLKCGHSDNADFNAATNILERFLTGPYGASFKPKESMRFL